MALKELILYGIVAILTIMGGSFVIGKGSTKILTQNIAQTTGQVNTIRNFASDYTQLNTTGDFVGINMEAFGTKKILPSGLTITGTGDASTITSPYDKLQKMLIIDPNSASATLKGKQYKITIDSTLSKMDADAKQVFEDKLKSNFEASGGIVSDYDASSADGKISVIFE